MKARGITDSRHLNLTFLENILKILYTDPYWKGMWSSKHWILGRAKSMKNHFWGWVFVPLLKSLTYITQFTVCSLYHVDCLNQKVFNCCSNYDPSKDTYREARIFSIMRLSKNHTQVSSGAEIRNVLNRTFFLTSYFTLFLTPQLENF